MQELIDLIDFIKKTKFKSNTLLDALIRPDSHLGKLFHALAAGEIQSDQDALDLFPEIGDSKKLSILKARLKNRLCDTVFLLDFREESHPDRQQAFVECVKKWSAAMILITKNIRSIGVRQLENLLRFSLDFEFTEISMNIIRTLELYYGTIEGNQKKYNELEERLAEMEAIWMAEREAERLYSDLVVNYVNFRADKHLAAEKASEYTERVRPLREKYTTFKIHFFSYLIQTVHYDSKGDYESVVQVCEAAVDFFNQKKYRSGMVEQTFYYTLVTACLYSRQFKRGQPFVKALEEMLEENSFNWFKVQELYFLMAMHTENYQEAQVSLIKVLNNPNLPAQPAHIQELWKVFEAYIQYLALLRVLPPPGPNEQLPAFKISRFVNDLVFFTKDKRGMNITVQIIEYLFYVAQNRIEECENRTEALRKYAARYLNDEATLRSRLFIKMLLQISASAFNVPLLKSKTAETFEQLIGLPWYEVGQHREIEVIPYEQLWPIVLQSLNFENSRRRASVTTVNRGFMPPPG